PVGPISCTATARQHAAARVETGNPNRVHPPQSHAHALTPRPARHKATTHSQLVNQPQKGTKVFCAFLWLLIHFEDGEKRFLRDLDPSHLLHALLAFLLLLEQLAFARDVAAITLRNHVLAERLDRLTRDHLVSNRSLNRNLKQLPRYQLLHLLRQRPALRCRSAAMQNQRQRIPRLARDQHVELHQIALPVTSQVVIERGITT